MTQRPERRAIRFSAWSRRPSVRRHEPMRTAASDGIAAPHCATSARADDRAGDEVVDKRQA
eukprot:10544917-Heterocapsa_arctica.AAC.1